tara:strand:- start:695 stop:1408 length:714 start_codon:yes stop_codon:yes gene_type:complete
MATAKKPASKGATSAKTKSTSKKPATKKAASTKSTPAKVEEEVVEDVIEEESVVAQAEPETVPEEAEKPTVKRRTHSRESVLELIDELTNSVESEITALRAGERPRGVGIKALRSTLKKVKLVRTAAAKVMKSRTTAKREPNSQSGFLKPVVLSKEMADFTGWDPKGLHSRVDVTKFLCNYIKENDLQNHSDRRVILADDKLASLLGWDKKSDVDLTYYRMQTQMKNHFTNPKVGKE